MRLFCWGVAILGGVGAVAMMPVGAPARGAVSEITGGPEGQPVGEVGLPESGGPEILPAASVLLGACVLIYALLLRRRA